MCLYMYTCRHCVFVGCVMLRVVLAGSVRALQEMVKCGSETSHSALQASYRAHTGELLGT